MTDKKSVLIAEDDEPVRRVIKNELEKAGIKVIEAQNGEEALAISLNEHPSLILLDVLMPKMHGMEFLRKLHDDEWGKSARVILLTNFAEDPRVLEAVKEGRCGLLNKAETRLEDVVAKIKEKIGA
ncbi:MAG: response regulator [Patescibacteria group bacterium]|jgi:two-component system alkaline phosphatase synthesis response regulator PhoP